MKKLLLILVSMPAFGQQANWLASTGAVTLSSATTAATIQQPASNGEQTNLTAAVVRCPAACIITQRQNDTTPATATAGTISGLDPYAGASFNLTFWTASNASGGTVTGVSVCDAACTIVLDLTPIFLPATGTKSNYTIAISSVTGDAYITFYGRRTQ